MASSRYIWSADPDNSLVRRPGQLVGGRPGLEEDDSLLDNRRLPKNWILESLISCLWEIGLLCLWEIGLLCLWEIGLLCLWEIGLLCLWEIGLLCLWEIGLLCLWEIGLCVSGRLGYCDDSGSLGNCDFGNCFGKVKKWQNLNGSISTKSKTS